MAILRAEDIVAHNGDVEAALKEKRVGAREHYGKTGAYPPAWEPYVRIHENKGRPRKFNTPEEYWQQGMAYFMRCLEEDEYFTVSGLALGMGFPNPSAMRQHAIAQHGAIRDMRATMLSMVREQAEKKLLEPGSQTGPMFVAKGIPDAITSLDDVNTPEVSFWQDKKTLELTGANGGAIKISRDLTPEEAYMQMLEGGTLEEKTEANEEEKQAAETPAETAARAETSGEQA